MAAAGDLKVLPQPNVQYENLKAWIATQDEYQREHSKPATLTDTQLRAIEQLINPSQTRAPESDFGNTNWVSQLDKYRNAHPKGLLEYNEKQTEDKIPRWTMKCILSESESPFPLLASGEKEFSFARKKDAKKHAAKCAIEWLIAEGLMPDDGTVTFPKPKPKPPPQPPPPDTSDGGASIVEGNDGGMSASQRVHALCTRLGVPSPSYTLLQDKEIQSLFSGWAEITGGLNMPTKLGHVSDVYTKKAAKEQIAVNVLEYLLKIERERGEQADKVLQSL